MKVGDLVKFDNLVPGDARRFGTVLNFDLWHPEELEVFPTREPEKIVEVFWNTGKAGWILQERVKVINEPKT